MIEICLHYGRTPAVLPSIPAELIARATANDLRVLLTACTTSLPPCEDPHALAQALAARVGCTDAEAVAALAFWRGADVLAVADASRVLDEAETTTVAENESHTSAKCGDVTTSAPPSEANTTEGKQPARKAARRAEMPYYTTDEVANFLESRAETRPYLDECSRLMGRMLNAHEIGTLISLADYLCLDWDYILATVAHCARRQTARGGHRSIRYVETAILDFYDEGIRDLASLQEKLRALELLAESEGRLRALFGMGSRALTPKEKKHFNTWLNEFHFDLDVIRLAYEVTVDAKGSPNMGYMNSVLANWNRDGLRTTEAVAEAQAAFRAEREKRNGSSGGSFDTEDFFDAAVRRSFGDSEP